MHSALARTVHNALGSGLSVVVVTTELLAAHAARHVATRDIVLLDPNSPPDEIGESIAAGVAARSGASGWLVLPGDMPGVRPDTLRRVASAMGQQPVIHAQYRGLRGHPVGFSAELYSDLIQLRGEKGARQLLARYPTGAVEVDDPAVLRERPAPADASGQVPRWWRRRG